MTWKGFWEGIASLFENVLFIPLDAMRELQLDSWFLANIVSWIFILVFAVLFIYWMRMLQVFHEHNEDDAHSPASRYKF